METAYAGIDYGMGKTNIDPKTGIRFGVINQREVFQAWSDSSEAHYRKGCGHCGCDLDESIDEGDSCPQCGHKLDWDLYGDEPECFAVDDSEYKAFQSGGDCDIFVERSPYYTHAQFCSPCAPGAGYLMNPCEDGPKTYCFGHNWFEDGKAPYPVYSVATGERVMPG